MNGWVKIHRKIAENNIWLCEKFTRGQAWIDLILLANHENGYFYKRGVKVNIQRGQVGVSEVGLSDRWMWSRTKVRKFLKDLEEEQQIIQQKCNVTQIVTIINYNEYQDKEQQKNSRRTAEEQQKDTNKKNKEEKRRKEINISFDEFWNIYDKKVDNKVKVESKWINLTDKERELIMMHVPKYKESQPDKKYRKNPMTYLNNKSWNDEILGQTNKINDYDIESIFSEKN